MFWKKTCKIPRHFWNSHSNACWFLWNSWHKFVHKPGVRFQIWNPFANSTFSRGYLCRNFWTLGDFIFHEKGDFCDYPKFHKKLSYSMSRSIMRVVGPFHKLGVWRNRCIAVLCLKVWSTQLKAYRYDCSLRYPVSRQFTMHQPNASGGYFRIGTLEYF